MSKAGDISTNGKNSLRDRHIQKNIQQGQNAVDWVQRTTHGGFKLLHTFPEQRTWSWCWQSSEWNGTFYCSHHPDDVGGKHLLVGFNLNCYAGKYGSCCTSTGSELGRENRPADENYSVTFCVATFIIHWEKQNKTNKQTKRPSVRFCSDFLIVAWNLNLKHECEVKGGRQHFRFHKWLVKSATS